MYKNLRLFTISLFVVTALAIILGTIIISNISWNKLLNNYCEKKKRQIDYYVNETINDLDSIIVSHAVWTEARENLFSKNSEWLYDNATGYLLEDDSYGVDFQLLASEDLNFIEYYGVDYFNEIRNSKAFKNALENDISSEEILWFDDTAFILVSSPVYDNNGENPTGVYLLGKLIDKDVLGTLIHVLGPEEVTNLTLDKEANYDITTSKNYQIISMSHRLKINEGEAFFNIVFSEPTFNYIFTVQRNLIFTLMLIAGVIAIRTELRAIKKVSKNIGKIITSIERISKGKYREKMDVGTKKSIPEINILSLAINNMSSDIEDHISTIEKNYLEMIEIIISAVEINDPYTYKHNLSVMRYAVLIGTAINYEDIESLEIAAKLHDIGKISIPSNILNKKGLLTEKEFKVIKRHPIEGYKLISKISFFEKIGDGIKYHHERFDGTGYPYGLKGRNIPLIAQIISVADVFDALTSDRVYRKAMSCDEAMKFILQESGKMFNPLIVDAFCNELKRLDSIDCNIK
ncbi:HD domain-containing protein [Mycoplasmatota bacterium WC44]